MQSDAKIPVTIITGFLGSGKTTLLNRILSEHHGLRIAVIENEFGAIGIDHALVINVDEEVFEMSNGCICCTVRGDLIRVLENLLKRRDRFDYVLIETTGLANPGPVAQTFFMDDEIRGAYALDGIITVVDAKHIDLQLARDDETIEQLAFADVVVLNKCDLVEAPTLDVIERRVQQINKAARVYRSTNADISVENVVKLHAFDLDKTLERRPTFLEPEYPFEWGGHYRLDSGEYEIVLEEGPDPTMDLVVIPDLPPVVQDWKPLAESCVRRFGQPAVVVEPGDAIPHGLRVTLDLATTGRKNFTLRNTSAQHVVLVTQHHPDEFNMAMRNVDGASLALAESARGRRLDARTPVRTLRIAGALVLPSSEHLFVAEHEHNDEVGSVCIDVEGDLEMRLLQLWLGTFVQRRGADIYRMKGILSIRGDARRFVFQGVHMLFDGKPAADWGGEQRRNQLVFIGKGLDGDEIRRGFAACLAQGPDQEVRS